jgi:hypothetical protein
MLKPNAFERLVTRERIRRKAERAVAIAGAIFG